MANETDLKPQLITPGQVQIAYITYDGRNSCKTACGEIISFRKVNDEHMTPNRDASLTIWK